MGKSGKQKFANLGQSQTKAQSLSEEKLKLQLKTLLQQKNYRQAIDKLKQICEAYPNTTLETTEANLWLLKGQQEYDQNRYTQAETSFRTVLELGLNGEAHYWLAKCCLATDKLALALDIFDTAFESKALSKDYAGCYLKLLILNQQPEKVSDLITHQASRFSTSHLQWAKGILALQANQPAEAVTHFEGMEKKRLPGDATSVWVTYAHQQNGNWQQASQELGMNVSPSKVFGRISPVPKPPAIEQLWILQAAVQKQSLHRHLPLPSSKNPKLFLMMAVECLGLLEEKDFQNAAHFLHELGTELRREYPEVEALFRPVMIVGGQEALKNQDLDDTTTFWQAIIYQPPFDRELALKLNEIYAITKQGKEQQRLLTYIIGYVKNEAQMHPQDWPINRLNAVLAKLYCFIFDAWMVRDQRRQAFKALQEAEQLCETLPDVIGRQGLKAKMQGDNPVAIAKLKEFLENGCDQIHFYEEFIELLTKLGDTKAVKDARRRYGKVFGDFGVDNEVEIPKWIRALSTQTFWVFEELVQEGSQKDSPLKACCIFVDAAEEPNKPMDRVNFDHAQAQSEWDGLLGTLNPSEQVPVLQAILIATQLFAKRQKGLAALQKYYQQRLLTLANDTKEATPAFLVVLALKEKSLKALQAPITTYLEQSPQPGTALAQIQLQARYFMETDVLQPVIDSALQRESQNPLLLLAKATTFKFNTDPYQKWHDEGFELARRLQDAAALQAYREEEFIQSDRIAKEALPSLFNSDGLDLSGLARRMIEKLLGKDATPELIEELLPQLMGGLGNDMPNFFDDDDDDDSDFFDDDFFEIDRPFPEKNKTKKKKRFTDL